jgi:hypothetical protein
MPSTLAAHFCAILASFPLTFRLLPPVYSSSTPVALPVYSSSTPVTLLVDSSSTSSLLPACFLLALQQFNPLCGPQFSSTPLAPFPRYLSCLLPQHPKR